MNIECFFEICQKHEVMVIPWHFTHSFFLIQVELLAVRPYLYLPFISTEYLFTHQVNCTFTPERLAECIITFA